MKRLTFLALIALSALSVSCTGYKLGSTLPESIQSVGITVKNKSDEPSIEVAVMHALRQEVQLDGRLALLPVDEADTRLEVELIDYDLDAIAYDRFRGTLAEEYRVILSAKAVFYDAETGEVLREIPLVTGDTDFPFDADLTSSKRAALDDAADDLARKIVSRTIAAW
jgi:hypothetical protein